MVGESDMAASFAISELFMLHCEPCLAEFEKQNQVFTGGVSTAPYVLVATRDINSPEKIKGMQLRAAGPLWDRFATFVGATGANVPSSQLSAARSRATPDPAM